MYSIRSRDLQQRPLVEPAVQRDVLAVDMRGRVRSPAARLFLEEIKAHAWEPRAAAVA